LAADRPQHGVDRSEPARADESVERNTGTGTQLIPLGRAPPRPSRRSLHGFDWFIFFLADAQVGFGPLVAVYLTAQKWTQGDIGLVLTVGGLVALAGQIPGGALVDAARSERFVAALSVMAIAASALMLGVWPIFAVVLLAKVLHSVASCVLGPAIGAISLGLVGHAAVGTRFGRNARFASLGAGFAALGMGAIGYMISNRAVIFVTVVLCLPTLLALWTISANEIDVERAHGGRPAPHKGHPEQPLWSLVANRPLMIFALCLMLFHMANAEMLPLTASVVTMRSSHLAAALVAGCILVPQIVVALLAPWVGRQSARVGRRPMLVLGFGALLLRGILLAMVSSPYTLVAVQVLDGISAAVLAVLVPLVIADVTRGTGHFNLAQGVVGSAVGVGASLSPVLGGYTADSYGSASAFLGLAAFAFLGLIAVLLLLPETGGAQQRGKESRTVERDIMTHAK
jgi:predicted MFS family arabinose efflux permease